MMSKVLWAIAILLPTSLAGFVIGLTLDFTNGERQTAAIMPTTQSDSNNLEASNTPNDHTFTPTAQWKVYLNGLGSIRVGMSPREASQAIGRRLVAYGQVSGDQCYYIHPEKEPKGVDFMIIGGRIARIDIKTPEVTTVSGARVGNTENQIRSIYPGQVAVSPHNYVDQGHYLTYIPKDPQYSQFRLVFETDGKVVTSYRAGKLPEVQWIEGCS